MTFRRRIALLAGLSFVAAVIVCSLAGYAVVRREMLAQIDHDLLGRVAVDPLNPSGPGPGNRIGAGTRGNDTTTVPGRRPGGPNGRPPAQPPRPTDVWVQTVSPAGTVTSSSDQTAELPVDDADRALAGQPAGITGIRDVHVDGVHLRMVTASTGQQLAIQVARPLTEVDETLSQFARALIAVSLAGSIAAAGVGWFVARRAARPVTALTAAAEHVAETLELDHPLGTVPAARTDDEIGRLTTSITAMLDALRLSREQQRRLVLDASHEFRTPLTSLRTNVDLLSRPDIDEATRADIVSDLQSELEELTDLTTELVQLATDRQTDEPESETDLLEVARRVAERATKRTGQRVEVLGESWTLTGHAAMLERAVQNLVDNACKWNPPGAPITVRVEPGRLSVDDHGPGIPDAERELVFERFYRAESARTTPGSGLGLAIVRQIVRNHDGEVHVDEAAGGGSSFTITIPAAGSRP